MRTGNNYVSYHSGLHRNHLETLFDGALRGYGAYRIGLRLKQHLGGRLIRSLYGRLRWPGYGFFVNQEP